MSALNEIIGTEFFQNLVAEIYAHPVVRYEEELTEEEMEENYREEMANRAAICHSQGLWY